MVVFANLIVIIVLVYYIKYLGSILLFKKARIAITQHNNKLDNLRKVAVKSLDEQKDFISEKYPKKQKSTISWWIKVLVFLREMIIYIIVFSLLVLLWNWQKWDLGLGTAIIIIIIGPLGLNWVLSKFKLQKELIF